MFPLCTYQSPQGCEPSSSTLVSCSKMQRNIAILISSDFHLSRLSPNIKQQTHFDIQQVGECVHVVDSIWILIPQLIKHSQSLVNIWNRNGDNSLFMLTLYTSWNDATPPKRWRTYLWYCGRQQQSGRWCKCSSRSQLQSGSGISAVLLWSFVTLCTCEPWRSL